MEGDLITTGTVDGHDLMSFADAFYKSRANEFTGIKTFKEITVSQAMTSTGDINGLDLATNLVFLDTNKTLVGNYSFAEVDIKNLQVNGLVDGVFWDAVDDEIFRLDTEQTITGVLTFGSPTQQISFTGAIVGDGNLGNGLGLINGQRVESLSSARETWNTVSSVKTAAQAEAYVLCNQVKTLSDAYLHNVNVEFYDLLGESQIADPTNFGVIKKMTTFDAAGNHYLVALGDSKLIVLMQIVVDPVGGSASMDWTKMEDLDLTELTNPTDVVVVSHPDGEHFMLLVVSDEGLSMIGITVLANGDMTATKFVSTSTSSGNVTFPCPGIVGVKMLPELDRLFMSIQGQQTNGKYNMEIISYPISHINIINLGSMTQPEKFATLISHIMHLADPTYEDTYLVWRGDEYDTAITSHQFDVLLIQDTVIFAVTNHLTDQTTNFITGFNATVIWPGIMKFNLSDVTTYPFSYSDFVLLEYDNVGYIAGASYQKVMLHFTFHHLLLN